MVRRSTVALLAAALAIFGGFLLALGPATAQLGWLPPRTGFVLCFGGALLGGLLALLTGAIALYQTRAASGLAGRPLAWAGLLAGAGLLLVVVLAGRPGAGLPAINDISTDLDSPPEFVAALRDPANQDRDMGYPPAFVAVVREAYADLDGLRIAAPPEHAFEAALRTARELGWEIVDQDPAEGRLEARETSRVFRFVDDVVVRVRPDGRGSRIDVRSKSRDGKGDLGVNAARIRAFLAAYPR